MTDTESSIQGAKRKRLRASCFTVGCKVNQSDTAYIEALLKQEGYEIVPFGEPVDVTVVNTCTVTSTADFKSRQKIRQARRCSPHGIVVATGCYVQRSRVTVSSLKCTDHILDNRNKFDIIRCLNSSRDDARASGRGLRTAYRWSAGGRDEVKGEEWPVNPDLLPTYTFHTRAFIKIQDGCSESCTYCIVPFVRGKSRSRYLVDILSDVEHIGQLGFREVVLTGVNLGAYSDPRSGAGLCSLVEKLLMSGGAPRVRLSSIEPPFFDEGLIELAANAPGLCHHFHLPLQSADPHILEKMGRRYTVEEYGKLAERIHANVKDVSLGTDVITGFPGEGDREFARTRQFLEAVPFSYVHVFPYSKREMTKAAGLDETVDDRVIRRRASILRELGKAKRRQFREKYIGQVLDVLFESPGGFNRRNDVWQGLSSNYIRVFASGEKLANRICAVRINAHVQDGLEGELLVRQ
jgi:threonylcarbamoyladenosine tRNA methylthiotransferase MtaB